MFDVQGPRRVGAGVLIVASAMRHVTRIEIRRNSANNMRNVSRMSQSHTSNFAAELGLDFVGYTQYVQAQSRLAQ